MSEEQVVVEAEVVETPDAPMNTGANIQVLGSETDVDTVDDNIIQDIMGGVPIEKYVYVFEKNSVKKGEEKFILGLTLAGVNQIANKRGGIEVKDVIYERTKYNTWAVIVKVYDQNTNNTFVGAFEEEISFKNKHPFTKAVHKAQRNAIKQLLPVPMVEAFLAKYVPENMLGKLATPAKLSAKQQDALPEPDKGQIDTERKGTFAAFSDLSADFEKHGVTQDMFFDASKIKFNKTSRAHFTLAEWSELRSRLHLARKSPDVLEGMSKVIKEMLANAPPKEDKTKAAEPVEDKPVTEQVTEETKNTEPTADEQSEVDALLNS